MPIELDTYVRQTGEYVSFEYPVVDVDGVPANLTGATAELRIRYSDIEELVVPCTIEASTLLAELTDQQTRRAGTFPFEFWVTLSSKPDCVAMGLLELVQTVKRTLFGT